LLNTEDELEGAKRIAIKVWFRFDGYISLTKARWVMKKDAGDD
jgi:hypothetical protein